MVIGSVKASGEAVINVRLHGPEGQSQEVTAIVDTGFNGWLTLPSALIGALRLPFRGRGRATLADAREILFDIYEATLIWDGQPRLVAVHASDTDPLVGMGLFYGCELTIQVVEGGSVAIKKLS